jgi:hypothetical protein
MEGDVLPLARGTSSTRWCCRDCSRVQAGLEAPGGNHVCPVTHLEPEEVVAPGQHAVWAVVAVTADQDRRRTQKVDRQVLRGLLGPSHVVPGGNDFGSTYSF